MLWGKKVLRVSAAVAVAVAAAHTAESQKGQTAQEPLLIAVAQGGRLDAQGDASASSAVVPTSASLTGNANPKLGDLTAITPVAATTVPAGSDHCRPTLDLAAMPGAMIQMSLAAPCNRSERIVVRHSGLSFTLKTASDGSVRAILPALKSDAMVAVYLADTHLVLGHLAVPDVADYTRLALMWDWPTEIELRVTDGDRVLVGNRAPMGGDQQAVLALGATDVQSPLMANVYSKPGTALGDVKIAGELRITPASCGRTLRLESVFSVGGIPSRETRDVAVPLCGTAGDILQLKNLAPDLTLHLPG